MLLHPLSLHFLLLFKCQQNTEKAFFFFLNLSLIAMYKDIQIVFSVVCKKLFYFAEYFCIYLYINYFFVMYLVMQKCLI